VEIEMKVVAFERSQQGTGASRRLRISGKTPGIVYGAGTEPKLIELDHNALYHALNKEAFHSSILDLEVAGASEQVLLRDVQYHPFKQLVLHVDFQRVDAKTAITTKVPLHYMNQEGSPAVKLSSGVLTHVLNDLEISCLPGNLPEFIEVDLAKIEIGQSLHAKDVALPKGVTLTPHIEAENPVIVSATLPAGAVSGDAGEGATPTAG
jgi:large subunit ribosomal protein L25